MPRRRLRTVLLVLVILTAGWWYVPSSPKVRKTASTPPAAQPFQRLAGCRYLAQAWNDGDSFHVALADGAEQIFRLYFVDAPESGDGYAERTAEQAAYFGISPAEAMAVGREARAFTQRALARPFTVETRWRNALGRSKLPRYYALVTTADGQDLAELLVGHGLARIYGTRTPLPDGEDSRACLARLKTLEEKAKAAGAGAWRKH